MYIVCHWIIHRLVQWCKRAACWQYAQHHLIPKLQHTRGEKSMQLVSITSRCDKSIPVNSQAIQKFWGTKHKSTTAITEQRFSCQNKLVWHKWTRSYKKIKIGSKTIYTLFAWKPSLDICWLQHLQFSFWFVIILFYLILPISSNWWPIFAWLLIDCRLTDTNEYQLTDLINCMLID